jgi:hypothetical protein
MIPDRFCYPAGHQGGSPGLRQVGGGGRREANLLTVVHEDRMDESRRTDMSHTQHWVLYYNTARGAPQTFKGEEYYKE